MLGERERRKKWVAVFLRTGRKLRPVQCLDLFGRQPKNEVLRKPFRIAFHLLVETLGRNVVEFCQVRIDHHLLAARELDAASNAIDRDGNR